MDKYTETFKTWDKIAGLYEDKFMYLDIYNDSYDRFLKSLKKSDASVLEIGCGPGNITKYLLNQNPHLKIKGIDISENMIRLARKNNPNAEFEVMDCRNIGNLITSFDAVVCGFCLPYLSSSDCLNLITDSKNLLNDSGILYLSFVPGDCLQSGFVSGSTGDRTYFYYHPSAFVETALETGGFKINNRMQIDYEKSDRTREVHFIIIAEKLRI